MAGMLDLHILLALQNGWEYYTDEDNKETWKTLFPGIRDETLDGWHAALRRMENHFRTHYAKGAGHFPCIVVQQTRDNPRREYAPLGDAVGEDDAGRPLFTMLLEQSVRVMCFADNPELSRAMDITVRAILQASVRRLLTAGYTDIWYDGAEGLLPEEDLAAENMGIFVKKQVWQCLAQADAPSMIPAPDEKPWWVHLEQVETVANEGEWQAAPIDPDNIDPETGEPYPPGQVAPEEGVAGTPGGVVVYDE